jgi:putative ABC transport system permease protein
MRKRNLGFEKENVLVLDNLDQLGTNQNAFKNWLQEYGDVRSASFSNMVVPHLNNNSVFRTVGENPVDNIFFYYFADQEHLATMGMEMVAGRFFSEEFASDSTGFILNEAAMHQLGWDSYEDKQILSFYNSDEGTPLHAVGVVKDFNFESLKVKVRPLLLLYRKESGMMTIRIKSEDIESTVKNIAAKWNELSGNAPFEYVFLDADFDALFRAEQRMGSIFFIFTVLAIVIACLGLFGLASFTTEQRAKEMGIRKIMGASTTRILTILSGSFTRLVLISFLITAPLAYYGMNEWLNGFAYRIPIGLISIAGGGVLALLVTWFTISFQSIKAARANPVDSLRSE